MERGLTPEGKRALDWARRIVGDTRTMREELRAELRGRLHNIETERQRVLAEARVEAAPVEREPLPAAREPQNAVLPSPMTRRQ